jgi:predicted NAD/FAD-binding protein
MLPGLLALPSLPPCPASPEWLYLGMLSDTSLMPLNRKTWSSWNLIGRSDAAATAAVCVTYWVNRLQVRLLDTWAIQNSQNLESCCDAICCHSLLLLTSFPMQELPPGAPNMFVTLNPLHDPAADKVIRKLSLAHPVFRLVGARQGSICSECACTRHAARHVAAVSVAHCARHDAIHVAPSQV